MLKVLLESKIFELREIQKEAIRKGLFFRKSFLVCAPSGSGKTLIGELCLIYNAFQKLGKSVYLVPFKALATEKYYRFKKLYQPFNIKVELSIGDYDVDDSKLENADVIVTTYEKMDSLLRNFSDKEWISDISTMIVDEIYIVAETDRGPRLESLIVRINEFLQNPQIIGLSATIANPDFFNSWLKTLGNDSILIKSDERPVPLHYSLKITQNKDSTIKNLIKTTLSDNGQVLVFLNKRKSTQELASNFRNLVKKALKEYESDECKKLEKALNSIKGGNVDLKRSVGHGIAFHHAGLLPKERKAIEDGFRSHVIKVICCTTTLSAGINMPARLVILRDFKRYLTSGYNVKNFSGLYENGDGFNYFMPFSPNEIFQMLGRAGRPGYDSVGYGVILVNNVDEKMWIEDHCFQNLGVENALVPKYNDLKSGLNNVNTLKEQVLLRIYEEKKITLDKLKQFFEKTYFWYHYKDKLKDETVPIEQLLMIQEISPVNVLKLHSEPERVKKLKDSKFQVKLSNISNSSILGHVKTDLGVYTCEFSVDSGIKCSCGFNNGSSDNYLSQKFAFEFCDHVTYFILYLIQLPDKNLQRLVSIILPRTIKNQYVLNYLFSKGLILKNEDDTISCSQFGKLVIRLYLYPTSGILIRTKLESCEITNFRDLTKEAYDVLIEEGKVRNAKMLEPLIEWSDEEPLDNIIERYKIMAGDLHSVIENFVRMLTFVGIIARYLSNSSYDLHEKLVKIAEMSETLKIRSHYGIREELFDLVLRLEGIGRVRARMLFSAGYHTANQVLIENPYVLARKTGLGVNFFKSIIYRHKKNKTTTIKLKKSQDKDSKKLEKIPNNDF